MRKYNGAISLFMIIILLTSFIFGGVFIDASRMIVAKAKIRNATNTALRSTMSYYDKKLVGSYGLYAFDQTEAEARFKKYFKANMAVKDDNIRLFEYTIPEDGITVNSYVKITNDNEFNRQVVEFSKYRAPVTTTLILVDKITEAFTSLKSKKDKIKGGADKVQSFKDQFRAAGNQITVALRNATTASSRNIKQKFDSIVESATENPIVFAANMRESIANNINTVAGAISQAQQDADTMRQNTDNYVNEMNTRISDIESESTPIEDDGITSFPAEGETGQDIAQQAYNQVQANGGVFRNEITAMTTKINNIKSRLDTLINELESLYTQKAALEPEVERLHGEYQEHANVVGGMLTNYQNYNNANNARNTYQEEANRLNEEITNILNSYSENPELYNAVIRYRQICTSDDEDDIEETEQLREDYPQLSGAFGTVDSYNTAVRNVSDSQRIMDNSGGADIVRNYNTAVTARNNAYNAWDEANNELTTINNTIATKTTEFNNKLDELSNMDIPEATELDEGDVAASAFNSLLEGALNSIKEKFDNMAEELVGTMDECDPETNPENVDIIGDGNGIVAKVKNICDFATSIFNILENVRDHIYTIDYIMDHCTYLTSPTGRDSRFSRAEVEYIIFGINNQPACLAASVALITTIRFAINFIDYAIRGPGGLIAKCIYGLGRGAAKTVKDISDLFLFNSSEGIGLCPSFPHLKLTYSDHLRLMLLLKFNSMQPKLKNVIKSNLNDNDVNIENLYTKMTVNTEVEVNLIVLPIFFGSFEGEHFRNGNYVFKDTATLGY